MSPRVVTLPPDVVLSNGDSIEFTTTYTDGEPDWSSAVVVRRDDSPFRVETSPHASRLYVTREESL